MKDQKEAQEAISRAVETIRVAMLTTREQDGGLRSRPMVCAGTDADALWFITQEHTPKVAEAEEDREVNVTFASPEKGAYVSVTGRARIVHDPQLLQKFWRDDLARWFSKGMTDPDLALLRVDVEHAENWDLS